MGIYKGIMGGIDSMVASRFTPWHYSYNEDRVKLTDLVIESGKQALVMAGIDWHVMKVSLGEFMPDHEGADDYSLLLRGDKQAILGVQSDRYGVIQNSAVAELADAVIAAVEGASIESAGSLYVPGKVVWMLVRLPDAAVTFGSDGSEHHERYVLVSTTHDGSGALTIRWTDVRVQCMNTMSMAMGGSRADYVIRHTSNAMDYVEEAKRGIAIAQANSEAFDVKVRELLDTELDEIAFAIDVLPKIVGTRPDTAGRSQTVYDDKFGAIVSLYGAPHNEAIAGTAWAAVNAVNEYEEWIVKPRKQESHERQMGMLLKGDYPLTKQTLALVS